MAFKDALSAVVPEFEQGEPFRPSRRKFVQALLGGSLLASAASFLYPVIRYVVPPPSTDMGGDTVLAATTSELKPNSAKIFKFGSRPGLLVRTAGGEYKAVSAVCTHLSCTVQYKSDVHQIWCACHNGLYGLDGRNISGPPPRPLEAYDVHLQGDQVVVSRKREA